MRSFRGVPYAYTQERIDEIADLHFIHGRSYGEIAKLFGYSRQQVAGVIHRWRRNTGKYPSAAKRS